MRTLVLAAASLAAASASAQEKLKIAVIPTQLEASAKGMVPDLFDDYLLTAVQNTSGAQVIGQDDIGAMLGFEKQKDLLNCDDTSCMADIGGALGVDKIVAVKVARLGEDWVATAKLINIKTTRVEQRVNEIVGGDVKALLHAVPRLIAKLFGQAAPADPAPRHTERLQAPAPAATAATAPSGPNPAFGRGPRIAGTVMLLAGGGLALIGGLWATSIDSCEEEDPFATDGTTDYSSTADCSLNAVWYTYSIALFIAGMVVTGVGAKLRAKGAIRRDLDDAEAGGSPAAYWLGWVLAAGSMVAPFAALTGALDESDAELMGWGCGLGALATFFIGSMVPHATSTSALLPVQPTIGYAHGTPLFGVGARF